MSKFIIRNFELNDRNSVVDLWCECGLVVPWNNPHLDIDRKYSDSPELFFVVELDAKVVATCMSGYDGHRGWIYFLAVASLYQKQGIASELVTHVEDKLKRIGCPEIELMVRATNQKVIGFYENIGYCVDPVSVLSKRLITDKPHDLV